MKNNRYNESDSVSSLLSNILGKKGRLASRILKSYRIETIEQFIGAFKPFVPITSESDHKSKEVVCSFATLKRHKESKYIISRIQKTLQITNKEAKAVLASFDDVKQNIQSYHFNFGFGFGVAKKVTKQDSEYFWKNLTKLEINKGSYVIPNYHEMGKIYDQGNRGTCVANAVSSLLNYKGGIHSSRQFLYHQCKMIDGNKNREGTSIGISISLLTDNKFADIGNIMENTWSYVPREEKTIHQGPPPEEAFSCSRIVSKGEAIYPRKDEILEDIKYLINFSRDGRSAPVVIAIPLYESFFSKSTSRTGWVTMPLPGEAIVSYHAMIITGYDEERKLFLVRNSWGITWASENDKGYNGHAWIPYEYIKKHGFDAVTITDFSIKPVYVPLEDRLYNNSVSVRKDTKRVAHKRKNTNSPIQIVHRRPSITTWVLKVAMIILLLNAYKEPIRNFINQAYQEVDERIDIDSVIHDIKFTYYKNR